MRVYVVMGNDYPESVWSRAQSAASHIRALKRIERAKFELDHPRMLKSGYFSPRIHWRYYKFDLQSRICVNGVSKVNPHIAEMNRI